MRSSLFFALLAVPALAETAAPSATLQNLVANSPFGTANVTPGGAPAAVSPLEFRGTFVDGGERFFSILDTGTRRAEWVGLNEAGRSFTVKNYDVEKETVSLEFQGRTMELKLFTAKITNAPLPPPTAPQVAAMPGQPQPPNPANRQATPPQPSASEAQRLAQVAEEIRRRRALRQQATPAGAPPVPNAAPAPMPAPVVGQPNRN